MTEITRENYHQYLSYHGHDVEVAQWVVEQFGNSDAYNTMGSVKQWVDASRMVIEINKETA